jgi:hypothetical protein
MIKSKAIDLLKTFTAEEMKEFGLFISSPFFNKEKVLIQLFDLLMKYYPLFTGRGFTKEKIFTKIYPGKKYNDGMLRNSLSKIHSLGERFIAIKNFESQSFEYELRLLESLSERKLEKQFKKQEDLFLEMLSNEKSKDSEYYKRMRILDELRINLSLNQKSSIVGWGANALRSIQSNLRTEFLISIYKNACYLLNERKQMYSQEHDKTLMDKTEEYILKNREELKNITYIWYYYNSYKLASTQKEEYFYELREILSNKYDELSKTDKRNIYVMLTNFCYVQRNSGNEKYSKEHFSLLRENIKRGEYQTTGGFMSHIYYMNAVIIGLGTGESDWVLNFMKAYKDEMDEINKQNTYDFCNAFYNYTVGDYNKALQIASTIETNDLSYKHQLKSLYLKIFFDMNSIESFYSHIDSYKHFIANENNASKELRNTINSYITFAKKLFDLKNSAEDKDFEISKLEKEVQNSKALINKVWILERISAIKKREDP